MEDVINIEENYELWVDQWIDVPLSEFGSGNLASVMNRPHGISLIVTSARSEFASTIKPVIGSLAAGNCTILLPRYRSQGGRSELNKILLEVLEASLSPERFGILSPSQNLDKLFETEQIDFVFASCRKETCQTISKACYEHEISFIPHTRGWNVGIISDDAEVEEAADALAQNKFYKSGQDGECLDVIYVHESVYDEFLIALKNSIFYYYGGKKGKEEMTYGKIYDNLNFEKIFERLEKPDHKGKLETSIFQNEKNLQINPIILKNPDINSSLMNEKLLGPILPIRTYSRIEETVNEINHHMDIQKTFFFGKNPLLFNFVRDSIRFQEIFFNSNNSPLRNMYMPQHGYFHTFNCMLNGVNSFYTFSKQRMLFIGLEPKDNLRKGNLL